MNGNRSHELRMLLETTVREMAGSHSGQTRYREPVFGYADADDPRFMQLKEEILPGHLLPRDLLPEARSVFCFFLPFDEAIVRANRKARICADEWAIAYEETNALISRICGVLTLKLGEESVPAAWQQPTRNFDPISLKSAWSHKSIAVITGIGTLGLHHMLITERGCAGRVGSIVVGAELPAVTPPIQREELCGFYQGGKCRTCISLCPASAIREPREDRAALDKHRCHEHCLEVQRYLADARGFRGALEICGKCATGPCGLTAFH